MNKYSNSKTCRIYSKTVWIDLSPLNTAVLECFLSRFYKKQSVITEIKNNHNLREI